MILRAWIEIGFGTLHRRRHALVFQTQLPPRLVVFLGRNLAGEHLPSPFVDHQRERQERDLLQSLVQQQPQVFGTVRHAFEQSDLLQILGRHRQRDGVADRLVKSVIGAVPKQKRLLIVGALVEVMSQLVMDGGEILSRNLDARLDPHIVHLIHIPSAGMAHHFPIARLHE